MQKGAQKYFKPSVTVDIVVFTIQGDSLKVLTIRRSDEPFKGVAALPGGFLHAKETTLEAARRILKTKVGLNNIYLEQLFTFDDPDRDPRGPVLSVSYFALVPFQDLALRPSPTVENPEFTAVKGLRKLAFDHTKIIQYAHERIKGKLEYTNIAFSLLPEKFTFAELQKVYEIVFGRQFDRRNFRKKITRLELVKPTKEKVKKGRQRPALLYTSATKKTTKFKDVF